LELEDILREFVEDINSTGGLVYSDPGMLDAPSACSTWADLAITYKHACEALGVELKYDDRTPETES
jgi:hypothetical protein